MLPIRRFSHQNAIAFILLLWAALLPLQAHAGLLSTVTDLLDAHINDDDEAISMLKMVFGDFILSPFSETSATGGNMLGAMFMNYNMFIFTVAMVWFAYSAMAGLAQTMHEGVVLGRRMSTVWAPIRFTFGAASLMPVFGGWAFCQALMVLTATLGVAGANLVASTAVESAASFKVLVNPMQSVKQAGQLRNFEVDILRATACTRAANIYHAQLQQSGLSVSSGALNMEPKVEVIGNNKIAASFPRTLNGDAGCGRISLEFSPRSRTGVGATFGFRIDSVNYEEIRKKSMEAHEVAMKWVVAEANRIVAGALTIGAGDTTITSPSASLQTAAVDKLMNGYFGSYGKVFDGSLRALHESTLSISDGSTDAAMTKLTQEMRRGGFATLGVWYAAFAEINEAMNEMLDPVVKIEEPVAEMTTIDGDVMNAVVALISEAKKRLSSDTPTSATGGTAAGAAATGNTSIGQYLTAGLIDLLVGSSGTGHGMINPILAFKNLGDNSISVASTAYLAYKLVNSGGNKEKDEGSGVVGGIMSAAGGMIRSVPFIGDAIGKITDTLKSIAADAGAILPMLALLLFAAGAGMAFYIPMIPFIQWFAGLLQWFTSIVESLIGSSLWALAHFDADGEGMGQRASYGYLYMLNNFARPIIMVFAFFIASAAITVLGSFLFRYYMVAIASAQGNTITGLISIAAYLVIFMVMGITLVNGAFSIMLNMADRIIGWIGTNASSEIGRDMENRVNAMFVSASRASSGVLSRPGPQPGLQPAAAGAANSLADMIKNKPGGGNPSAAAFAGAAR